MVGLMKVRMQHILHAGRIIPLPVEMVGLMKVRMQHVKFESDVELLKWLV